MSQPIDPQVLLKEIDRKVGHYPEQLKKRLFSEASNLLGLGYEFKQLQILEGKMPAVVPIPGTPTPKLPGYAQGPVAVDTCERFERLSDEELVQLTNDAVASGNEDDAADSARLMARRQRGRPTGEPAKRGPGRPKKTAEPELTEAAG